MFTQLHKVQRKLITFLGDVVPTLDLLKDIFCNIATVCMLYLNCRLHQSVQEVNIRLYTFIIYKCTSWRFRGSLRCTLNGN